LPPTTDLSKTGPVGYWRVFDPQAKRSALPPPAQSPICAGAILRSVESRPLLESWHSHAGSLAQDMQDMQDMQAKRRGLSLCLRPLQSATGPARWFSELATTGLFEGSPVADRCRTTSTAAATKQNPLLADSQRLCTGNGTPCERATGLHAMRIAWQHPTLRRISRLLAACSTVRYFSFSNWKIPNNPKRPLT
jgi:hypothetical protein